ncbi:MAG: nitroreductase family protein [Fervidicoccaceae archaeon]|jgi:nitroreductase
MGERRDAVCMEIIKGRRCMRSFREEAISEQDLRAILEAGIWAPSGSNAQPWKFFVVRDRNRIDKIKMVSPGLFGDPPLLVILSIDRERMEGESESEWMVAIMDAAMAGQNMMLMAYSLGIGSCPMTSFNRKAVKMLLEMPSHIEPVVMISFGFPKRWPSPPKRRSLDEVVHYERFG